MKILRASSILCALAALSACDLTGSDTKPANATNSNPNDQVGAIAMSNLGTKDAASDSVVSAMQDVPAQIGGRMTPAARQNLLDANYTYKKQLAANPGDPVAGFGIAVTSLSLNADDLSDTLKHMWDAGLRVGDDNNPSGLFKSSPTAMVKSQAFSARALANPVNAPKISQLQNVLKAKLMPSLDSAISFLTQCWNTPNFKYQFSVRIQGDTQTMAIGRADVGFALAGLRTAKQYFTWLLAQNLDCDFNGSYVWLDTLSHINGSIGPTTSAQNAAFQNLQTLLAPGSTFLTLRTSEVAAVNAIPTELKAIAKLAKEAGDYSVKYQLKKSDGLVKLSPSDNNTLAEVMDSVNVYLGGFHTYTKAPHDGYQYVEDSLCSFDYGEGQVYTYSCGTYKPVTYPGFSVTINVSKLITQADHKVFLPRYSWNASNTWATKGPFSLVKGSVVTPMKDFNNLDINGPKDMAPYIEWADPTFGGAFAFQNSAAVLNQLDAMNEKPVSNNSIIPNYSF